MTRQEQLERDRIKLRIKAKEVRGRKELDALCRRRGLYWLQNVTETYDEQAAKRGVPAYKPFPMRMYFAVLWWLLTHSNPLISGRVIIPKSREMMTSWLIAGYITWFAQWHDHTLCLVQTQSEEKVKKLLTYSKALYDRQPDWMRAMHPLKGGAIISTDNRQLGTSHEYANGSVIKGLPAGARQIPLYHPAIVVFDEMAHLVEAQQSYDFASPVTPQVIGISSAGPGFFDTICNDEMIDSEETRLLAALIGEVDFSSLEM